MEEAGQVDPRPPLAESIHADVVVIGGGFTGMWAAWELLEAGATVALLEGGVCGHGPSGRNGGFLLAGVAAFHNDARDLYGRERNRRIYARTVAAQQEIYELARALGLGDAVRVRLVEAIHTAGALRFEMLSPGKRDGGTSIKSKRGYQRLRGRNRRR